MANEQLEKWQSGLGEYYADLTNKDLDETRKRVAEALSRLNPDTILEVGSNTGEQSYLVSKLFPKSKIHCVDPSAYAVSMGKIKYPNFEFKIGHAESLPYEDKSMDLVFTAGSLMHIPDKELVQALKEIKRVAKRWVAIEEYVGDNETIILYSNYGGAAFLREYNLGNEWKVIEEKQIAVYQYKQIMRIFEKI